MSQVADVYAQALYSLAKEEDLGKIILEQLDVLHQVMEPGFLELLAAPNLTKEERCGILDHSFRGKVEPYLLNFMKLLTEKGYIRRLHDCCKAYREAYNADNGILPVTAVTAVPLTQNQIKKLTDKLAKITGKTVELTSRVDPAVLGGVRLDYSGRRVDGTVKNRLDTIGNMLQNTVL